MTQRITPQMQSGVMLANINNDLAALDNTQNQLSTGMKILQPSDDPAGMALSLQLSGQISALNNYSANVNDGTAWANTASAALQSIQQITQTARTLVVEANDGTMNASDQQTISTEISQLVDQIKDTANTQYDGMYIFSGSQTTTAPYQSATGDVYNGDSGSVTRTIGPGTTTAVNAQLSSVLGQGQQANGGQGDGLLLNTLETIGQDVTGGTSTDLGNDLSSLDSNISSLESLQAQVGSVQDQLSMASSRLMSFQTADQSQLANTEDVDMGSASINFSTEQAAYSAALQSGAQIIQTSLLNFLHS